MFLERTTRRDLASGWWYVAAGVGIGIAIGIYTASILDEQADSVESGQHDEEKRPSLVSRLLKRIPTRVTVGAGLGAAKGGGKAAIHEVKERFRSRSKDR